MTLTKIFKLKLKFTIKRLNMEIVCVRLRIVVAIRCRDSFRGDRNNESESVCVLDASFDIQFYSRNIRLADFFPGAL